MSKTYAPLLPAVTADGTTTEFTAYPVGSHYTSVDEGIDAASTSTKLVTTTDGDIEELLLAPGIETGVPGNITELRYQFYHKGTAGTDSPIVTFEVFIDPLGNGSRTQVGESKTVSVDTSGVADTGQITWLDSDSTPFTYNATNWAAAAQRVMKMTVTVDPGGTPEPDEPNFERVA